MTMQRRRDTGLSRLEEPGVGTRRPFWGWRWKRLMALATSLILLVLLAAAIVSFASPGLGAQGAELLRGVLGDRITADIESGMFGVQDAINSVAYRLGLDKQS